MAILTFTRQIGSYGDEIGMMVARRLGYTFYDKNEIEKRIIAKGLPKEEFVKFDERRPSFRDRFTKSRDKYLNYLSAVILEIAAQGNCVIMGRGAFLFLSDVPGHIALRFITTPEQRLINIKEMTGWSLTTVQKLFNDPSFPSIDYGKQKLVENHALMQFLSVRREKARNRYWR